jgi:acetoin utilization deacetylase AcuC-like enzyme
MSGVKRGVNSIRPRQSDTETRPREVHPVTIVADDRCLDHHTGGADHPETPARWVAIRERLRRGPLAARLREVAPREASRRWVETAHSSAYISRFEEAALSGQSYLGHPDCQICYDSFRVALVAAGSGLTGVDLVEADASSPVFCGCRPPGHHAERALAMGFCFFNNAAIAARYWQEAYQRKRVLVLDFDAHHGNGIQSAFEEDPTVLYVSIHEHPTFSYPGTGLAEETGTGEGVGATLNVPLPPGATDDLVRAAISNKIDAAVAGFQPDAMIAAAGFDGHRSDDMSGLAYSTELYGQLAAVLAAWAKRYCHGRFLSLLEGGYHLEALAASVETYLVALAKGQQNES